MAHFDDLDILARTIYGEARGEYFRPDGGVAALIAVGNVILNRLHAKKHYGKTIAEVCQKAYQFSCWNPSDPNSYLIRSIKVDQDDIFKLTQRVAQGITKENWPDLTKGANHYHASWLSRYPDWSQGHKVVCRIGQHLFYKLP